MSESEITVYTYPELTRYEQVWDFQRELQRALINGDTSDSIILTEHHPVITVGKSGSSSNVIAPPSTLHKKSVNVLEVERGGDVTYHGPGQLVAYPILDLRKKKRDVNWYLRSLEEIILRTLSNYNVQGMRIKGKTGVWTAQDDHDTKSAKIASIGVRLSRWCTLHGFSINVLENDTRFSLRDGFSLINPCGFTDIQVSSLSEGSRNKGLQVEEVQKTLLRHFGDIFGYRSFVYGESSGTEETGKEEQFKKEKDCDKEGQQQKRHPEEKGTHEKEIAFS